MAETKTLTRQNGGAIREIRQREGLTVSDLAKLVGVTDPHIRNIENEARSASPEHLALIAKALGCTIHSLRRMPIEMDAA